MRAMLEEPTRCVWSDCHVSLSPRQVARFLDYPACAVRHGYQAGRYHAIVEEVDRRVVNDRARGGHGSLVRLQLQFELLCLFWKVNLALFNRTL